MLKLYLSDVFKMAMLLFIAFILVACSRESIDIAEFQSTMTAANFEVIDATYQLDRSDVDLVLLAMAENYQIQLTEFSTTSAAERSFHYFMTYAEDVHKSGNYTQRSSDGSNFSSFSLTASGIYVNLLRIENIVLFTEAPSEYRDEIREAIGVFD